MGSAAAVIALAFMRRPPRGRSSVVAWSGSPAARARGEVREKKTSSSVASRRRTSWASTPPSSSARTTSISRVDSLAGAVTSRPSWSISAAPAATRSSASAAAASSSASSTVTTTRSPPCRAFSWLGEPVATILPWSSRTTSSASGSASSRYWVVRISVVPPPTSWRSRSQSSLRLSGSRPVVGSSRKRTGGEATRLAARSSRRRMPPL